MKTILFSDPQASSPQILQERPTPGTQAGMQTSSPPRVQASAEAGPQAGMQTGSKTGTSTVITNTFL